MAQPVPFNRLHNLTQYALDNPGAPYNAAQHDAELNAIEVTLDGLCLNLGQIQRDDGRLANASVHQDAFTTAALALIAADWRPRGAWTTATVYAVGDLVEQTTLSYVCNTEHTSGTFSADRAANRWTLVGGTAPTIAAADTTFTPTGSLSSTTVQAALAELDGDVTAHLNDTTDAHDASAISYAGSAGLSAVNVEEALDELDSEKAPKASAAFTGSFSVAFNSDATFSVGLNGVFSTASGASAFAGFVAYQYGPNPATGFAQFRARGTQAAVTDSQAGDPLNAFAAYGWNNGNWRNAGSVRIDQESYTAGVGYVVGTIRFFNVNYSGVDQENFRIWGSGALATGGVTPSGLYNNRGDISLPADRNVRAKNTAKAWVMFDVSSSSPIIQDAVNVTSIGDNGAGDYTLNFSNAMANAAYAVVGTARGTGATQSRIVMEQHDSPTRSTTQVRIYTLNASWVPADCAVVSVGVFGS